MLIALFIILLDIGGNFVEIGGTCYMHHWLREGWTPLDTIGYNYYSDFGKWRWPISI